MDLDTTKIFLKKLYKAGLVGAHVITYIEMYQKVNSLKGKNSDRVRHVAELMRCSTDTVYRAIKLINRAL